MAIIGTHALLYSSQPEEVRDILRGDLRVQVYQPHHPVAAEL